MATSDDDFLRKLQETFRSEAGEHLAAIVAAIVALEQAAGDASVGQAERILRPLHTLKGAARAAGHDAIESLCHAMEEALAPARTQPGLLRAEGFDLLHQAASLASQLLDTPASGRLRNQVTALAARLAGMRTTGQSVPAMTGSELSAYRPEPAEAEEPLSRPDTSGSARRPELVRVQARHLDAIRYQVEELLDVELGLERHVSELLRIAELLAGDAVKQEAADGTDSATVAERQCRRLAAELGRTRRRFHAARTRLMDAALETALVPLGAVLEALPGLVRNLARRHGKQAELVLEGEVEIDRRVLDVAREALIHLVTNAVDHGLESPERRLAAGKSAAGTVRVSAARTAVDHITLHVFDDGAGIDVDALLEAAIRKGALRAEQAERLDARQKLDLALLTGVSTRNAVTEVSGRGVGLAVVAEKVGAIGGALSIDNRPGAGCTFSLQLPVRLTTLPGLVVRARGIDYVLPLGSVTAARGLGDGEVRTIEGRETLLVDGRVLPVLRLGGLLGVGRQDAGGAGAGQVLLLDAGSTLLALQVDEIVGEQEVLPKTLGKQLRRVRYLSGAALLGDGRLALVLAPDDIARHGLSVAAQQAGVPEQRGSRARTRILVVEDSITSRLLLKHILEGAGHVVETAVDGLDALSRLRQGGFDLVVSDIEMPRMDGLELTMRIRSGPETETLPVVLVTTLQSPQERERGLRAGADAYVAKGSFDQDNLLQTVRRLVGRERVR